MDTKDQDTELDSSGVMLPDSTMVPPDPELLELSNTAPASAAMAAIPGKQAAVKSPTPLQESLRRLRRDTRAMISIGVIVLFVLIAIIGPAIYQHIGATYTNPISGASVGPDQYHNPFHQELGHTDEFIS